MSVSQSPAGVTGCAEPSGFLAGSGVEGPGGAFNSTVDQLPTDELLGLPRQDREASDATIRLDSWARECDWIDLEDAIYRLGEMAGELLDMLEHAVECDEDECETCPTQTDVSHYRLGLAGGFHSEGLNDLMGKISNLLERVR